jgi:glycosyltransferase involved in cell wall biosynthesis
MLRILHLSRHDITGGAARATYRLHKALQKLGHDSRMLVLNRRSDDPSVWVFQPRHDIASIIRRRLRQYQIYSDRNRYARPTGYAPFTDDRSLTGKDLIRQLPSVDILNLHWVARLIDYRSFFPVIPARTPVVWRLADMAPFTGGCHYDGSCGRFAEQCGCCPQLGSEGENDLSHEIWRRKQRSLAGVEPGRLHIVALSRWMANQVRRSSLFARFPLTIIPNGVDIEELAPRGRSFARNLLGIPAAAKVVLFIAETITNRRKGLEYLVRALSGITGIEDLFLLSVGRSGSETAIAFPGRHLDFVESTYMLSVIYSAADVFVVPSLEDNFPNTAVEAMACGTPVVGFDVGGLSDIVRPGRTGALAPQGETDLLKTAILELLKDDDGREQMAHNCRSVAVAEYALQTQTRRYLDLYESLIETHSGARVPTYYRGNGASIRTRTRNHW